MLLSRPFGYSLSFFSWSVIPNHAFQWHYENIYSRYMITLYNYNILLSALFTKVKCDPSECLKEKSWKYTLSSELKESLTDVVLIGSMHLCGGITLGIWLKTGPNVWYCEDGLLINFSRICSCFAIHCCIYYPSFPIIFPLKYSFMY